MPYLITAYLLNIIDYIFTAYWVHKFGIEMENSPFGRWLFENDIVWLYKIIIIGVLFALMGFFVKKGCKSAIISAKILLIVYGGIVVYHLIILFRVILIYVI
jgi:hypothetical protein